MWHRVDIVLTVVSEERITTILKVENKKKSASELAWAGATMIRSSETSVNTIFIRCHIPEDCFHHSHRRGNLNSYKPEVYSTVKVHIVILWVAVTCSGRQVTMATMCTDESG
jgi:predicted type IV restriction endonuclease